MWTVEYNISSCNLLLLRGDLDVSKIHVSIFYAFKYKIYCSIHAINSSEYYWQLQNICLLVTCSSLHPPLTGGASWKPHLQCSPRGLWRFTPSLCMGRSVISMQRVAVIPSSRGIKKSGKCPPQPDVGESCADAIRPISIHAGSLPIRPRKVFVDTNSGAASPELQALHKKQEELSNKGWHPTDWIANMMVPQLV